jgi:release factor glutamine methyltransferase
MQWNGFSYDVHPDVYRPAEDTFLLAEAVARELRAGERFLEVGCGAGMVSLVAARAGAAVWATDLNPRAVELALRNAKRNGIHLEASTRDLLDGLSGPFDVVAFNPPYLPTAEDEVLPGPINLAFDGGRDGNATVLRFAQQIGRLAQRPRLILVVHSSLANHGPLGIALAKLGYAESVLAEQSLDFERISVRAFRLQASRLPR